jgi:hypothetical protein
MMAKLENELATTHLFDQSKSLPGFDKTHIYHSTLLIFVANPHIAKALCYLPFEHKLD